MISDEMRELLSTYVDGELRDPDAVRVEEMSKRDPELRREIEAYRILARRLKEWDEAEHAVTPTPAVRSRALARARHDLARRRAARGGRLLRLCSHPVAVAAGLLIAAGVGRMVAGAGETAPILVSAQNTIEEAAPAVAEDYRVSRGAGRLRDLPRLPAFESLHRVLRDGLRGYLVDGEVWTLNSKRLLLAWSQEQDQLRRLRRELPPERTTGSWHREVLAIVRGYEPSLAPFEGLVVLGHEVGVDAAEVGAVPVGMDVATDYEAQQVVIGLARGRPRLLLAGEILVGEKDGSDRTRLVGASSWVEDASSVPVTWADEKAAPRNSARLVLQPWMLGPEARRQLVRSAEGAGPFRAWLRAHYKAKSLADLYTAKPARRRKAVAKLVAALRRNPGATGFAVVADGRVMGIELFANHGLMMAFAPRLLHGYLIEAGPKAVSLKAPARGADADKLQKLASALMDRIARSAVRVRDVEGGTTDAWAPGLRRVNVLRSGGRVVGHGMLRNQRPVQMTLFGE